MNKSNILGFFLIFIFLANCSFDDKTGIWSGDKYDKKRITELNKENKQKPKISKIYSSENIFSEEKTLIGKINLSEPRKILSWEMHGLNNQNSLGNIYLSGIDNRFLKKKVGKKKFPLVKITSSPLIYKNNIFFSDDSGSIFCVNQSGKIVWKKNIYKKIYKKIYKNLSFSIYKNNIYITDNIGFIYGISLDSGKLIWIKNHGIPFRSKIKIIDNKIIVVNQDNRILAFNTRDGSKVWDIRSISSFIKSQSFLSLAITKNRYIIASNSSGDLLKINSMNGNIIWSLNTLGSMLTDATDFFKSSDIVLSDDSIIFSTQSSIFSYNIDSGYINWERELSSVGTPIIDGKNIFFVTENGYFVIANKDNGKIISSTNIFKILKKKNQETKIIGFIMGSGKVYSVTLNGFLIESSASSGKVENFKKIDKTITSSPIIHDGKLFIYTGSSKILGFN